MRAEESVLESGTWVSVVAVKREGCGEVMPDGGFWLISYGVDFNADVKPMKYLDQYVRTITVRVSEGFGYKARGAFCTLILRNLKSRNLPRKGSQYTAEEQIELTRR